MKKMLENILGKSIAGSSREEIYIALLNIVKQKMDDKVCEKGKKKLYYISAEFLIGKLLSNNLINLKLYDEVKEVLKKTVIHLQKLKNWKWSLHLETEDLAVLQPASLIPLRLSV